MSNYTPTWENLSPRLPEQASIETVLETAGLNWEVGLFPAYDDIDGKNIAIPDTQTVRRLDTLTPIGRVGNGYVPVQNREAAGLLQTLVDRNELLWGTGGLLREGQRVFLTARLAEDIVVDKGGVNDKIQPFITAWNSHVSGSSFVLTVGPVRPTCANMERVITSTSPTTWRIRHTRNVAIKMAEAYSQLGLTREYYDSWAEESTALARTRMSIAAFDKFLDEFWDVTEEASKSKITRHENRKEQLHGLFSESETTENCRGTAYAARCAITEYYDFVAPIRPHKDNLTDQGYRARRALEGDCDDHKTRAHRKLMTLTVRR